MGIVFNEQSQMGRSVFLVWFQGNSNENEPAVFFCFVLEGREGVWLVSLVLVIWSTFKPRQEVSILMQPSAMKFEKHFSF